MPDGRLTFEQGVLTLDGYRIQGMLVSSNIRGAVRFDEAKTDNLSGTKKTPLGWEDDMLTFVFDLLTDDESDCYEKLKSLNAVFKGHDSQSNPKVYSVINEHVQARGIRQVVFSGLESQETDNSDIMTVTLLFSEHTPPIVIVEKRQAGDTEPPQVNADAAPDSVITVDVIGPGADV